jgi:hypothetical protein
VINSLSILNEGGTIVCHDLDPKNEVMQSREINSGVWTGDCWKAWVQLRTERDDLYMIVVDTDWGCGIIRRGRQEKLVVTEELSWPNFKKNRNHWLNLISVNDFKKQFPL